jgi:hypothetical protein
MVSHALRRGILPCGSGDCAPRAMFAAMSARVNAASRNRNEARRNPSRARGYQHANECAAANVAVIA